MIDAYTIGITLALEDGVSEGIVAIRRDLAALDAAVAASAAQLIMLRKLAADIAVPVVADKSGQAAALFAPAVAHQRPVPPSSDSYEAPESPLPPVSQIASQYSAPRATNSVASLEGPATTPLPVPSPSEQSVAAVRSVPLPSSTRPAPVPPAPAPTEPIEPTAVPAPVAITVQAKAPLPSVVQPLNTKPIKNIPSGESASINRPPAPVPLPAPMMKMGRLDRNLTQPAAPDSPAMSPAQSIAPLPAWPTSQPPSAPPSPSPAIIAPRLAEQAAPTASRPPAAPIPAAQASPPISQAAALQQSISPAVAPEQQRTDRPVWAELHLDGAALGRWVSRHLERQVNRPQSGATGFDPRITPDWAGAPIGN